MFGVSIRSMLMALFVDRGAGETGAASETVLASARALSTEGSRLRVEVDKFLTMVRAG
jgi:methyl-accepting chemotaxis protein